MNIQDIKTAVCSLRNNRTIFHSEADFQFALAWELQRTLPNAQIRLEYCPHFAPEMHVDIFAIDEEGTHPIELKYKTRSIQAIVSNECFSLKNHGAQDFGRYDFLRDVERIEKVRKLDKDFRTGYAIFLSNEPSYWNVPKSKNTVDTAFRIHEGRIVQGKLAWREDVPLEAVQKRETPIVLENQYQIHWDNYSELNDANNGFFKFCLVEVKR